MNKKFLTHWFITAVLLSLIVALTAIAEPHRIDKSFEVEPGGTLHLKMPAGVVLVEGWDTHEVRIQAEIAGSASYMDRLELSLNQRGNDVEIVIKHRKRRWFNGWGAEDVDIRFTIHVPYEYHTRIQVSAGTVTVDNIDGDAIVKNSAGTITIRDVFGNVEAKTSAGTITAYLLRDMGNVTLKNSTGSISILAPEDFSGTFNLRASLGKVSCSLSEFSGSGQRIQFIYNEGSGAVDAHTAIGSITVRSKE